VRNIVFAAIAIFLGVAVPLACAEVILRFLPVSDSLGAEPVDAAHPVFHYAPNRDLTWSHGWNFDNVNHVHINNAGYVNAQTYQLNDARPLLAVVGDSYVEAAMIPYPETLQGRLAALAAPGRRVYSFAASNSPLSQYLVWAREARVTWKAQALVVVIIGNDFDESLAEYRVIPGLHHYVESADGSLELTRFDFSPGFFRSIAERSTLARYLALNLRVQDPVRRLLDFSGEPDRGYAGNTAAVASPERTEKAKAAARRFLADLTAYAGWRADQVVFVVDGLRYPEEAALQADSYFAHIRSYFIAQAQHAGFETIDMDAWFLPRAEAGPVQFEFPRDGHWNGIAHGLAADAVAKSAVFARWCSCRPAGTSD
jgi:hypothetical protein